MTDLAVLEFGQRINGKKYRPRPAAYTIVWDASSHISVLRTRKGYFLPGGGIEPGETAEAALARETAEECGREILILGKIGAAVENVCVDGEGYFAIQGVFFRAVFGDRIERPTEPGHELIWLEPSEAIERLTRKSQVWAVTQVTPEGLIR
jgi:8-oxo-dGTP diphosphatase